MAPEGIKSSKIPLLKGKIHILKSLLDRIEGFTYFE